MVHPKLPDGCDRATNWFVSGTYPKASIMRNTYKVGQSQPSVQRYPKEHYGKFKSQTDVLNFVARLNGRDLAAERAKANAIFRHAFISQELLDEFERKVHSEITEERDARSRFKAVKDHFLHFFIEKLDLKDPLDWYQRQLEWGEYLISLGRAEDTIRKWIQKSNQLMKFLHQRFPKEIPLLKFEPISKAKFKHYEAQRLLDEDNQVGLFITDADWKIIEEKLPKKIEPFIRLAYYYGLRRAECLAVQIQDVWNKKLRIERVMKKGGKFGPPKSRQSRETDHWFLTPAEAYKIIEKIDKRMHPDSLSKEWAKFMNALGMDYDLHDLRRTFVTRALRLYSPIDVQRAVGHASIETTMRYVVNDQEKDTPFKPVG